MSLQIHWITFVTLKNKSCIYYDCLFFLIQGSARRLIKAALQEAARKREMRYSDLTKIDKKVRRHFHDDITVIVLFINYDLLLKGAPQGQPLSIRCALDY
jgi:pyruvate dehydrogenase phosphatase